MPHRDYLLEKKESCPNRAAHTPLPPDFDWNARPVSKTHRQVQCKGCELYVIWEPREQRGEKERARGVGGGV